RDTVVEFASDLSDLGDQEPTGGVRTEDAEAEAAVESIRSKEPDIPVLAKADLGPDWQGDHPALCIAGRTVLDEAAAITFAQICSAHGLTARVEGAAALSTSNIFRLE